MRWHLECKHGGKGIAFEGSFVDAARLASERCVTDSSCWVVWALPSNIRLAEATLRGVRWMKSTLSGNEIKTLMRRHRWTIASLAFRLGLKMARVRQVRERGLTDPLSVRDWIEAMTGEDVGPIPEKYWMRHHAEEASCAECGYPMGVGDFAYEYLNEIFCSVACCRHSRGWGRKDSA